MKRLVLWPVRGIEMERGNINFTDPVLGRYKAFSIMASQSNRNGKREYKFH
jgi:hypothetical protein